MNVKIIRTKRRTIAIKINEKAEVYVCCPYGYKQEKINEILDEKKEWIYKTVKKIEDKRKKNFEFYSYNKVMLVGKEYNVVVNNNNVFLNTLNIGKSYKNPPIRCLKGYILEQAKEILVKELYDASKQMNFIFDGVKIISARKKWGSCDSYKNIKLNYRLVMLDKECIRYVCIHELCHLKQMNHSNKFWALVEKYCPNYKEIKQRMKQFSFTLELF